jgi:hypothetical protein
MPAPIPTVNTNDRTKCHFDCTVFVDAFGTTLLTRQYALPCEQMRDDLDALHREHGELVYVLRSFNHNGVEVAYEIITPAALKCEGPRARVEYWHPRERTWRPTRSEGQSLSKAEFRLAGILIVPEADALTEAYDYLEYPYRRWNPSMEEGTSPAPNFGDILVMTSPSAEEPTAYALTDGYTKVVFTD